VADVLNARFVQLDVTDDASVEAAARTVGERRVRAYGSSAA
jgi:NAD(P)-dependent dehydrogenase (short-subunit alcohol dehydrogenase family)